MVTQDLPVEILSMIFDQLSPTDTFHFCCAIAHQPQWRYVYDFMVNLPFKFEYDPVDWRIEKMLLIFKNVELTPLKDFDAFFSRKLYERMVGDVASRYNVRRISWNDDSLLNGGFKALSYQLFTCALIDQILLEFFPIELLQTLKVLHLVDISDRINLFYTRVKELTLHNCTILLKGLPRSLRKLTMADGRYSIGENDPNLPLLSPIVFPEFTHFSISRVRLVWKPAVDFAYCWPHLTDVYWFKSSVNFVLDDLLDVNPNIRYSGDFEVMMENIDRNPKVFRLREKLSSVVDLTELPPTLEVLDLTDCSIKGVEGISGSSLREIRLLNNQIRQLPSINQPLLVEFHAANNKLTDLEGLDSQIHLRHVDLLNNRLRKIPLLPQRLRYLDVCYNRITVFDINETFQNYDLKPLDLEYLDVSHNCIYFISGLPQLQAIANLSLNNNDLTGLYEFINYPDLKEILLLCNPLGQAPQFVNLPDLQSIELINCSLTDAPVFRKLPKLLELILAENPDMGVVPNLNQCLNLEVLELDHNSLTKVPLFAEFTRLTDLTLRSNDLRSVKLEAPNLRRLITDNNMLELLEVDSRLVLVDAHRNRLPSVTNDDVSGNFNDDKITLVQVYHSVSLFKNPLEHITFHSGEIRCDWSDIKSIWWGDHEMVHIQGPRRRGGKGTWESHIKLHITPKLVLMPLNIAVGIQYTPDTLRDITIVVTEPSDLTSITWPLAVEKIRIYREVHIQFPYRDFKTRQMVQLPNGNSSFEKLQHLRYLELSGLNLKMLKKLPLRLPKLLYCFIFDYNVSDSIQFRFTGLGSSSTALRVMSIISNFKSDKQYSKFSYALLGHGGDSIHRHLAILKALCPRHKNVSREFLEKLAHHEIDIVKYQEKKTLEWPAEVMDGVYDKLRCPPNLLSYVFERKLKNGTYAYREYPNPNKFFVAGQNTYKWR